MPGSDPFKTFERSGAHIRRTKMAEVKLFGKWFEDLCGNLQFICFVVSIYDA